MGTGDRAARADPVPMPGARGPRREVWSAAVIRGADLFIAFAHLRRFPLLQGSLVSMVTCFCGAWHVSFPSRGSDGDVWGLPLWEGTWARAPHPARLRCADCWKPVLLQRVLGGAMDMDETVIDGRERGCVRRQTLSMRGAGMLFYFYTCFVLGVGADACGCVAKTIPRHHSRLGGNPAPPRSGMRTDSAPCQRHPIHPCHAQFGGRAERINGPKQINEWGRTI